MRPSDVSVTRPMPRGPNGVPTCRPSASIALVATSRQTPTTLVSFDAIATFVLPSVVCEPPCPTLRTRQHRGRDQGDQCDRADNDESVGESHHLCRGIQHPAEIIVRG